MPGDIAISGVRILLIDDDPEFCSLLNDYLELNSISLTCAHDGQSGLDILDRRAFDLILLDMFLPDINGLDVLRRIRRMQSPPVVMLSAHNEETDRIIALEIGADDYVPKPFKPKELVARVRARLRGREDSQVEEGLTLQDLTIDVAGHIVKRDGRMIALTPLEFDLLATLARSPWKVFSREELLEQVWGYRHAADTRLVNVHVQRLRSKIERDPEKPELVVTVRGVGYRAGTGA